MYVGLSNFFCKKSYNSVLYRVNDWCAEGILKRFFCHCFIFFTAKFYQKKSFFIAFKLGFLLTKKTKHYVKPLNSSKTMSLSMTEMCIWLLFFEACMRVIEYISFRTIFKSEIWTAHENLNLESMYNGNMIAI